MEESIVVFLVSINPGDEGVDDDDDDDDARIVFKDGNRD
jgi:hypothetical protein